MTSLEKSILLVDDDPKLLRGLERHLNDTEYTILAAVSAAEGLAVLKHHHVDAVICDNRMPGTSGIQFLADVKKKHPSVIRFMLTGNITKLDAWRLTNEIGVYRIFTKPCSPHELYVSIREAIETASPGGNTSTQSTLR